MKLIHKILLSTSILTISFTSCQKGKDIPEPGFGRMTFFSIFDANTQTLFIKIDGEIKDSLSVEKQISKENILLLSGKHQLTLVGADDNKILKDTAIVIETRKTSVFPTFWYRGSDDLLFDDYNPATMPKPAAGNILVRFITTGTDLPADIRIELITVTAGRSPLRVPTGKIIAHVTKDKLTDYLELPNPNFFAPAAGINMSYAIEGYDNVTNKKVMGLGIGASGGNKLKYENDGQNFLPDLVMSSAITSDNTNLPIFIKKYRKGYSYLISVTGKLK